MTLEALAEAKNERLLDRNCVDGSTTRTDLFAAPTQVYELRVLPDGSTLEATYETQGIADDGIFDTECAKARAKSNKGSAPGSNLPKKSGKIRDPPPSTTVLNNRGILHLGNPVPNSEQTKFAPTLPPVLWYTQAILPCHHVTRALDASTLVATVET